jgi:hypothetical protein
VRGHLADALDERHRADARPQHAPLRGGGEDARRVANLVAVRIRIRRTGAVAVASESFVVSGAVASAPPDASVTAEVPASPLSAFPVRASIASGTGSAGAPEDASGARGPSGTSGAPRTSPRCLGDARADVSRTRGARLGEAVFDAWTR